MPVGSRPSYSCAESQDTRRQHRVRTFHRRQGKLQQRGIRLDLHLEPQVVCHVLVNTDQAAGPDHDHGPAQKMESCGRWTKVRQSQDDQPPTAQGERQQLDGLAPVAQKNQLRHGYQEHSRRDQQQELADAPQGLIGANQSPPR
jgi:hypothetical protein